MAVGACLPAGRVGGWQLVVGSWQKRCAMPRLTSSVATAVHATDSGVFGILPFAYDVNAVSQSDLVHILPLVAVLIAILLAIVLRSLVAPLYLVASVVLSYFAAIGVGGNTAMPFGFASFKPSRRNTV